MPQQADQKCFHCQRTRPYDLLIPSEMLRRALKETIKKHDPGWTPGEMLCVDCLDLVREEYVEDALREEVGELTQLDQEVIRSMREQETLTENINVAFEKNITFGKYQGTEFRTLMPNGVKYIARNFLIGKMGYLITGGYVDDKDEKEVLAVLDSFKILVENK